jgi:hypothetical protein
LVPLHGVSTAVLPLLKFQPSYVSSTDHPPNQINETSHHKSTLHSAEDSSLLGFTLDMAHYAPPRCRQRLTPLYLPRISQSTVFLDGMRVIQPVKPFHAFTKPFVIAFNNNSILCFHADAIA